MTEEPRGYEYAPITNADYDPMARQPLPKPARRTLTTPNYTIVDGVVEYVKEPANMTTTVPLGGSVTYETMPVNIGTPIDVISSGVPTNTPGIYSAPRGVDVNTGRYETQIVPLGN